MLIEGVGRREIPKVKDDHEANLLAEMLVVRPGDKVFEIGVENRWALHDVLEGEAGCELWTNNIIDQHPRPSERFVFGDFSRADDLPAAYFDRVIDVSALHHFGAGIDTDADVRAAAQVARILKPGGEWFLSFNNFGPEYRPWNGPPDYDGCRTYNWREFERRIVQPHFVVVERELHPVGGNTFTCRLRKP